MKVNFQMVIGKSMKSRTRKVHQVMVRSGVALHFHRKHSPLRRKWLLLARRLSHLNRAEHWSRRKKIWYTGTTNKKWVLLLMLLRARNLAWPLCGYSHYLAKLPTSCLHIRVQRCLDAETLEM